MSFFSKLFGALGTIAPVLGSVGGFGGGGNILPLIATGITAATSLAGLLGGQGQTAQAPAAFVPKAVEGPKGPAPDPTSFARPTSAISKPSFFSYGQGLSPIQERAAIATGGVQGESEYRTPEAKAYYQNLALRDLVGENGVLSGYENILPVEKDYIKRIFGQDFRSDDTRGFLAALTRTN